jgi:hypothetical protein
VIAPWNAGGSSGPGVGVFDDFLRFLGSDVDAVEGEGEGLRFVPGLIIGLEELEVGLGGGEPTGEAEFPADAEPEPSDLCLDF